MITLLLIIGLTFHQGTYEFKSDIVRFEAGNNYVLCKGAFCSESAHMPIQNTKAKQTESHEKSSPVTKKEIRPAKAKRHTKITLPVELLQKKKEQGQKEIPPFEKDTVSAPFQSLDAPHKERNVSNDPFVIKPHGYFDPDPEKAREFLTKLEADDLDVDEIAVISKSEVNFLFDEQGPYISSADEQTLKVRMRYQGHVLRMKGYGPDVDETKWMIMSVMRVMGGGEVEDIQIYPDEEKRLVIVEVLNEN